MAKEKVSIGAVVKNVIKNLGGKGRLSEEEMFEIWKGAAGEAAATHSRPVSLKKSSLIVNVDGSSWLYELTMQKKGILQKLEGKIAGKQLKDIRFRVGETKQP